MTAQSYERRAQLWDWWSREKIGVEGLAPSRSCMLLMTYCIPIALRQYFPCFGSARPALCRHEHWSAGYDAALATDAFLNNFTTAAEANIRSKSHVIGVLLARR
ncbi:jg4189 [Pararge aegeria aegeria]|uniref:Jg4189 protein n=1 Tax=Pararge aegeria aegeria TaxID=348720 RepID=A0A8S4S7C5_9NEOP|nr:jg4189 [Pararge aegeria aegeria]